MWSDYTTDLMNYFSNYDAYFIDNGNGTCNIVGTFKSINVSSNGAKINMMLPSNVQLTGYVNVNISHDNDVTNPIYDYVVYGGLNLLNGLNSSSSQFSIYSSSGINGDLTTLGTYNFNCTLKFQYTNTVLN